MDGGIAAVESSSPWTMSTGIALASVRLTATAEGNQQRWRRQEWSAKAWAASEFGRSVGKGQGRLMGRMEEESGSRDWGAGTTHFTSSDSRAFNSDALPSISLPTKLATAESGDCWTGNSACFADCPAAAEEMPIAAVPTRPLLANLMDGGGHFHPSILPTSQALDSIPPFAYISFELAPSSFSSQPRLQYNTNHSHLNHSSEGSFLLLMIDD
jgi:hypothetical protein